MAYFLHDPTIFGLNPFTVLATGDEIFDGNFLAVRWINIERLGQTINWMHFYR